MSETQPGAGYLCVAQMLHRDDHRFVSHRRMKDVIVPDGASSHPGGVAYKASSNTHAPLRGEL
jgi:hypothetical protein